MMGKLEAQLDRAAAPSLCQAESFGWSLNDTFCQQYLTGTSVNNGPGLLK